MKGTKLTSDQRQNFRRSARSHAESELGGFDKMMGQIEKCLANNAQIGYIYSQSCFRCPTNEKMASLHSPLADHLQQPEGHQLELARSLEPNDP